MEKELIIPTEEKENGDIQINTSATESSDDWIRAGRLRMEAANSKNAKKELDKMDAAGMVYID